ncbi:MAG TPA: hypothetical protein VGD79_12170 [Thermoanaerobaculia bacterium]|jgi:hypothetical protein
MALPSVELLSIHYNGTTVFVAWQANIAPGFDFFRWKIFDLDSPWTYEQDTTRTTIEKPLALSADSAYQTYVVMYADGEPIVDSQIEFVISQRPVIDAMTYALGAVDTLGMGWPALTQTGADTYVVSIDSTGGSRENIPTETNVFSLERTLDTRYVWTGAVSGSTFSGISTGPISESRTFILLPPILSGVSYDLAETAAAWGPLEQPGAQKFVVTLIGNTTTKHETDDFHIGIPGVRDPQYTWLLSVAAESSDGVSVGPSSQQVTLILAVPSLDELDYDLAKLTPRWTKVPPTVTVSGYLVQLLDPHDLRNYQAGDVDELLIDVALQLDLTYELWVIAMNGIVAGPKSGKLTPLVKPATHVRLDTNLAVQPLITNWTVPNGGETAFLLQLYANGAAQPDQTAVTPPFTLAQPVTAGVAYALRLRPTGDKVKGPWSSLVPGPWLANIVYVYDRTARLTAMTWNGAATRTWSYDDAGNILSVTNTPAETNE